MSYQVIARKWRPQTFEEVTGQEAITQTLRNAIEHDRLHHAYLFSGARGVGKTTTARLLAKALNCHKTDQPNPLPCRTDDENACASCKEIAESRSIDVFEFDAASHTGVDDIREIILESINIAPARDRYKIFIIDEVHMLSTSSFNALLKTLEEPPPKVEFIMATTELHKVPITILSRCQEFEFRTIPLNKIFARLKLIAEAEKINVTDEALREISRSGEGSMRDAQSNFDQVISFSGERIEVPDVANALGLASAEMLTRIVNSIAHNKHSEALNVVDDLISRGHDLRNYCRDLLSFFRDLLIAKVAGDSENLLDTAILSAEDLNKYAAHFSESDLIRFFNSLSETESKLREATQSRYVLEIGLVKLIEMRRAAPIEKILERLTKLETALSNGNLPTGNIVNAATPLEKKTLKVDFPLEDVPFPTKNVSSQDISAELVQPKSELPEKPIAVKEISNEFSEPPEFAESFSSSVELNLLTNESSSETSAAIDVSVAETSSEFQISNFKFQVREESEIQNFNNKNQPQNDSRPPASTNGQTPKPNQYSAKSLDLIAAMPVKMMLISSEDLEHIEDDKLDAAYENILSRMGDNLFPIANAARIVEDLIGIIETNGFAVSGETQNGSAAAAPAKAKPAFVIPNYDTDEDSDEMPVMPDNPTQEDLLAYAQKHPLVKKVLRTFRGKIVEVKQSRHTER